MRSCPSGPKIASSSATSNFSAAATRASAACSGVSNALSFAGEAAGRVSAITLAAASPQASHKRRERFSFIDDEFIFFLGVMFNYLRRPPPLLPPPREPPMLEEPRELLDRALLPLKPPELPKALRSPPPDLDETSRLPTRSPPPLLPRLLALAPLERLPPPPARSLTPAPPAAPPAPRFPPSRLIC